MRLSVAALLALALTANAQLEKRQRCRGHHGQHGGRHGQSSQAEISQPSQASEAYSASEVAASSTSSDYSVVPSQAATSEALSTLPVQTASYATNATSVEGRMVFAHYMLIAGAPDGDWGAPMKLAKSLGVDAFAVNYGGWDVNWDDHDSNLKKMFSAAEDEDFKLLMSFDMTSVDTADRIVNVMKDIAGPSSALLLRDDKVIISTFQDGPVTDVSFDWQSDVITPVEKALSKEVFFMPGTTSTDAEASFKPDYVDGVLSWPHQSVALSKDQENDELWELTAAESNKEYVGSVLPWFFKHYADKNLNWGNKQDSDVFFTRFEKLLQMDVGMIELVTWNDFGESSYFGEPDSNVDWAKLSHEGFQTMVSYFIAAYKEGKTQVMSASNVEDSVFMFYRTQHYSVQGTDDPLGPPTDADEEDSIFVVSFLTQEAEITVNNGGKETKLDGKVGCSMQAVPFQTGPVSLKATAGGKTIADKTGPNILANPVLTNANVVCL